MRLSLTQELPAEPRAVWPFIVDPERMNRWSEARIEVRAPGDVDLVGMLRRISLRNLGRSVAFDEVIEVAEAPRRLVYRVVEGLPVRHHRGEITLAERAGGTSLRWDVDFVFPVVGVESVARLLLEGPLKRSLTALAEVVRDAPAADVARSIDVRDEEAIPELRRAAEAILHEQRTLADRLENADDPKRWFARVYALVTENQLALCDARAVPHPAWVLRLVPRFHHYYSSNLRGWIESGTCEPQWRSAFAAMDAVDKKVRDPLLAVSIGLARGIRAHIEEDLPRALAEIYVRHYAGRCAPARFRADYLLMRDVFRDASDRLMEQMPRALFPLWMRALSPVMTPEIREAIVQRSFYDVGKKRRLAFERGERLARLLVEDRAQR